MATFAKSSFSASSYASFRPTYSQTFYNTLLRYHHGPTTSLVELGTGHGLIARRLSPTFKHVVATDPSPSMISQARSSIVDRPEFSNIDFRQASAESLDDIPSGSVDAVIAGQAAHWFDFAKVWPELSRVVRKEGTVAFWGYKDNIFVEHPKATAILDRYCYAMEEGMMGPHWEQPGRNKLRDLYREIVPPAEEWEGVERREYEPATTGKQKGKGEVVMAKRMTLRDVEGYTRTFSAFINWADANPDRKARQDGGEGDVVDDLFDAMIAAEPKWKEAGENWRDVEVEMEWGSVMLMARKK
ncbi:hypothetical protein VF21_05709 [Pseudogymnoascus sp. 05NY08]|nr:hypothetical protein VF21_05709 [Pseudogymnoascus sp. 05NY08]